MLQGRERDYLMTELKHGTQEIRTPNSHTHWLKRRRAIYEHEGDGYKWTRRHKHTQASERASYGMGLVDGCRYGEREENIDHVGPKIIIHERP